jgi:hypothetical protein
MVAHAPRRGLPLQHEKVVSRWAPLKQVRGVPGEIHALSVLAWKSQVVDEVARSGEYRPSKGDEQADSDHSHDVM